MSGASSSTNSDSGGTKEPPDVKKRRSGRRGKKSSQKSSAEKSVGCNKPILPVELIPRTSVAAAVAVTASTAAAKATAPVVAVAAAPAMAEAAAATAAPAALMTTASAVTVPKVGSTAAEPPRSAATTPAPKLKDVVKEASDIARVPLQPVMRPPLGKPVPVVKQNKPSTFVATGLSYAQVSGSSNNSSPYVEIVGRKFPPRSPPSDAGSSRPRSEQGMQARFNARWQDERYGMRFEHIRGCAQNVYLGAIFAVIPRENLFSYGVMGRGIVEVFTTTLDSATKLMLEGIEVGGRHLSACPLSAKPTRVTFSCVSPLVDDRDLVTFLQRFATVHGPIRAVPLRVGDEGLGRGIYSNRREALISLNAGCVLPSVFVLNLDGSKTFIGVETEAKCHACHQVGHFIADCPKRVKKVADALAKEAPAAAETPKVAASPKAAPAPVVQPATKVPETSTETTKSTALSGSTPVRENVISSDEEATTSAVAKKRMTKRKPKARPVREEMPPPSKPSTRNAPKRVHSGGDTDSRSSKMPAVRHSNTVESPSGSEMYSADEDMGLPLSGCETDGSMSTMPL